MALLDGDQNVDVYPEVVAAADDYGNVRRVPGGTATTIRALVQPSTSEEMAQLGQLDSEIMRVLCRKFPAGPWAKVRWDGRDWDILGAPKRRRYFALTSHDTVYIMARSPKAV